MPLQTSLNFLEHFQSTLGKSSSILNCFNVMCRQNILCLVCGQSSRHPKLYCFSPSPSPNFFQGSWAALGRRQDSTAQTSVSYRAREAISFCVIFTSMLGTPCRGPRLIWGGKDQLGSMGRAQCPSPCGGWVLQLLLGGGGGEMEPLYKKNALYSFLLCKKGFWFFTILTPSLFQSTLL